MAMVATSVRLETPLFDKVKELAKKDKRSVNSMFNILIEKAVKASAKG